MDKLLSFLPLMRLSATLGTSFLFVVLIALSNSYADEVTNCGVYVKKQRLLAVENNVPMSRSDVVTALVDCRGGKLAARIAEQKEILSKLDAEIQKLDLRIDEQSQILDEQGRVLAKIISINDKLVLRIKKINADTARKLLEAEQILQSLALQK